MGFSARDGDGSRNHGEAAKNIFLVVNHGLFHYVSFCLLLLGPFFFFYLNILI